jgi:ketosteroid isomerase-like protein
MTNEKEMNALAERMTRAYEENDTDAVAACYTADARIWHNFDGVEQTVQDQLGATRMPLCTSVTVRDGRVARLDEYLDSAHLKPLQA